MKIEKSEIKRLCNNLLSEHDNLIAASYKQKHDGDFDVNIMFDIPVQNCRGIVMEPLYNYFIKCGYTLFAANFSSVIDHPQFTDCELWFTPVNKE